METAPDMGGGALYERVCLSVCLSVCPQGYVQNYVYTPDFLRRRFQLEK